MFSQLYGCLCNNHDQDGTAVRASYSSGLVSAVSTQEGRGVKDGNEKFPSVNKAVSNIVGGDASLGEVFLKFSHQQNPRSSSPGKETWPRSGYSGL